ncbi:MAG: signal transduction histidine kinase [Crocinitomicaceae bacterium]|jgi:two-component sensor histidine kinase|nr:signal transduction histidine kinase [Crocinitomicaceae bacterium]
MLSIIKALFIPNRNDFKDIFDKTRYLLAYRLTLFLSIALSILSVILFVLFTTAYSYLTISGLIACLASFIYIRKTGKYKSFIRAFNIIGAFLCIFTLYYVKDLPRIVDGFWMIISAIFCFLTLGRVWGIAFMAIHTAALVGFYFFCLNDQIGLIRELNQTQIFAFGFNILICFAIIGYLLWQNMKTTQDAERQLQQAKTFLEEQFELINQQNDEKTVLLKEIHHRVKNNLQVIVSLLRLQLRDIKNEEDGGKFNESINRVMTMSLIHEKIYQTEDFSNIDLEDYFQTLARDMVNSFRLEKEINFVISCDVKNIGLKPIVPLALIFNELLSNSIKYAFDGQENPEICLNMRETSPESISLVYSDNGKWREPVKSYSFGIELIEALSEQLNGRYEVDRETGTKYHFYFDKLNA